MVVADGMTSRFPDMLLWIELRASGWEVEQVQTRMLGKEGTDSLATMPSCTVKKEEYGLSRKDGQQMAEEVDGRLAIQSRHTERDLLPRVQGQRAVPMLTVALRADAHHWTLTDGKPDPLQGRLQIQTHLVHRQNDPIRMILLEIGDFFSASASHSAIAASLGRER